VGNFAFYFFDTVKEKLYNANFEEIPFMSYTTDPRVKITVVNPLDTSGKIELAWMIVDMRRKKAYVPQFWWRADGRLAGNGITVVDLTTRRATYVNIPGDYVRVKGLLPDGRVLFGHMDVDGVARVKLFDPVTYSILTVMDLPDEHVGVSPHVFFITEDAMIPLDTVVSFRTYLILPPNWLDDLYVPKRVSVSSPGWSLLRVQAEFHRVPARVRVRVWRLPDFVVFREEFLPGALSIDRLIEVPGGRYRVEVTAF
jgi:hypothetical protein